MKHVRQRLVVSRGDPLAEVIVGYDQTVALYAPRWPELVWSKGTYERGTGITLSIVPCVRSDVADHMAGVHGDRGPGRVDDREHLVKGNLLDLTDL